MAVWYRLKEHPEQTEKALNAAADALRNGKIVLFPTETVYGVGCDAMNVRAVKRLYRRKKRPADKPLLLHLHSFAQAEEAAELSEDAKRLLDAFCPGPLSLVLPKKPLLPDVVTSGGDTVGLRFPSDPLFRALSESFGGLIAATSANLSGCPSAKDSDSLAGIEAVADVILDAGPCLYKFESTVLSLAGQTPSVLRKGVITPEQIKEVTGLCVTSD